MVKMHHIVAIKLFNSINMVRKHQSETLKLSPICPRVS